VNFFVSDLFFDLWIIIWVGGCIIWGIVWFLVEMSMYKKGWFQNENIPQDTNSL